ncbi:MAG TPA: hypothetical protein VFZ32_15050 [Micromonosporaceae bacterium]
MTDTTAESPLTAQGFLAGSGADTAQALSHVLGEYGVARTALRGVRHLTASAVRAVEDELGRVADSLLDLDLGDVLLSGWRKYSALTESAHRTLMAPGSEEVLVLATHRVASTYRPHVDVFVQGKKVNSFEFQLAVVFDLAGVCAVVRRGHLVALRGGECLVTARLALEGARLWGRRDRVDLAWMMPLRPAVPLVAVLPGAQLTPRQPASGEAPDSQPRSPVPEAS